MTKQQLKLIIINDGGELTELLTNLMDDFRELTGQQFNFDGYVKLLEETANNSLKIGNSTLCTGLYLFIDSLAVSSEM